MSADKQYDEIDEVPQDIAPDVEVLALGICDCGERDGKDVVVYLSRRNLLTLINKLDANVKQPGTSACMLIKGDFTHPKYPQSHKSIFVKAVEDEDYYGDRRPGGVKWFGEDDRVSYQ